jgi:hypothetical protein
LTWRRFLDRFYAQAGQKGSVRNKTLSTGLFSAVERPFDSLETGRVEGNSIPPELIGNVVLTLSFILVAWALLREGAKWVIKLLLTGGIVLGAAVLLGLVDNTAVGGILYWVGASISHGVEIVATWLAGTWQAMMGVEESAG